MGSELTVMAADLLRIRSRWRGYDTIWGWLLSGLAVIVYFFGSDEKRHGDDYETAERRRKANDISRIAAVSLFVLAIIVDIVVAGSK